MRHWRCWGLCCHESADYSIAGCVDHVLAVVLADWGEDMLKDSVDLFMLFAKFAALEAALPVEWKREFQRELECDIGFAGLRPIRRVFV